MVGTRFHLPLPNFTDIVRSGVDRKIAVIIAGSLCRLKNRDRVFLGATVIIPPS